jgi:SAM-dependent methyltransferase
MEILNGFPDKKLAELFDFLGFIGIYEDRKRTSAYKRLMKENKSVFDGALVVEAGAGFGLFSKEAVWLGARKVYSVEVNRYMASILRKRAKEEKKITVVEKDIAFFKPRERMCDVLVHELFGPLVYDESLHALRKLSFSPKVVIPNQARLRYRLFKFVDVIDEFVDREVLEELGGALVADLFEYPKDVGSKDEHPKSDYPKKGNPKVRHSDKNHGTALDWSFEEGLQSREVDLSRQSGDLVCFYLEILHDGNHVLSALECTNWPLVWTVRKGNSFTITFKKKGLYCEPMLDWS